MTHTGLADALKFVAYSQEVAAAAVMEEKMTSQADAYLLVQCFNEIDIALSDAIRADYTPVETKSAMIIAGPALIALRVTCIAIVRAADALERIADVQEITHS